MMRRIDILAAVLGLGLLAAACERGDAAGNGRQDAQAAGDAGDGTSADAAAPDAAVPCTAASCPLGCCHGTTCETPSSLHCGGGGGVCQPCTGATPVCSGGTCVAPPPSCTGLPATCGPGGDASCCDANLVFGGTYDRGNDPSYPATVDDFKLEAYEVTVGRFRTFVAAGAGTQASPPADGSGALPSLPDSGWRAATWNASLAADTAALTAALKCEPTFATWTDAPGDHETRPMNCVDWYEAFAFCVWDGARMPTEAEWNYAAAGGDEQRKFPWSVPPSSMTIDPSHASYHCLGDGSPDMQCAVTDLLAVGTKPAGNGRWGQADLGGNVQEWVLDWYAAYYATPCDNCAAVAAGTDRVFRGGSFYFAGSTLLTSLRVYAAPTNRTAFLGLRCARSP
ncbi:MAG TPA: SUMF1/EgtB/PvdO family nonheme iron enzyme [Polyangia bacterium]|jgi:formylglycine-generating enzyme required for sulfatase activity